MQKVLLVGCDGADWRIITPLLDRGELPYLQRLVDQGIMGNLASRQPLYSPLLWTSVATGKLPDKHGIIGFTEVDEQTGEVRPSNSLSRKTKAIWNILSQEGLRTHVVNWPCSHPAEPINGVCVSEMFARQVVRQAREGGPLPTGTAHPDALKSTLRDLWVLPQDVDSQTIRLFVPRFAEVDQHNDHRLELIAVRLAECFSVHTAATWLMENEPWDFMAVHYGLIDTLCHSFMLFHPPRLPWVNEREYELYSDVVNNTYRLLDLLLGRLMNLAGPEAGIVLCSDHGWQSGHIRRHNPQATGVPAEGHRPVGVLAMKGPGIQKDELVHGASVLDITPTILTLLGLPVGRDMDGRVLADALSESAPTVRAVSSWEEVPGPAGRHVPGTKLCTDDLGTLMRRLVDLRYVEPPWGETNATAELTRQERKWNLARVHLSAGRRLAALPLLEDLYDRNPLRLDFGLALAECEFLLGLTSEACEVMTAIAQAFPEDARARMARGVAEYYGGRPEAALTELSAVEAQGPPWPQLFVYLGMVYRHLGRYGDAMRSYQRALDLDTDNADAHLGIALCLLHSRSYEEAVEWALKSLGLEFSCAEAHFCLGSALAQLGEGQRAIEAYETGLHFEPARPDAHRALSVLHAQMPEGAEKAAQHGRLEAECALSRSEVQERLSQLRAEVATRARERERLHEEESRRLMAAATETDARDSTQGVSRPSRGTPGGSGKEFLIVSGLPGSGTSLMMQMLAVAGLQLLTDGRRPADEDHPDGFFEWEPVVRLPRSPQLIEQAEGKAVKVISALLPYLPRAHRYRIIFMRRPGEEIAAAQSRVLERMGAPNAFPDQPGMPRLLDRLQHTVIEHLREATIVKSLVVDYADLATKTDEVVDSICRFLGNGLVSAPGMMASVVKAGVYPERAGAQGGPET